jgi:hypothetical protein
VVASVDLPLSGSGDRSLDHSLESSRTRAWLKTKTAEAGVKIMLLDVFLAIAMSAAVGGAAYVLRD